MSFANNYSDEGPLSGSKTLTFPWRAKTLHITNDGPSESLRFKFHESENYRTLKPYETYLGEGITVNKLYLSGVVDYRVWCTG